MEPIVAKLYTRIRLYWKKKSIHATNRKHYVLKTKSHNSLQKGDMCPASIGKRSANKLGVPTATVKNVNDKKKKTL